MPMPSCQKVLLKNLLHYFLTISQTTTIYISGTTTMAFILSRFSTFEVAMMLFVPIVCVICTLGAVGVTLVQGRAMESFETPVEKKWPCEEKPRDNFMDLEGEKGRRARVQKKNLREMGMV
jgi:hypothetical protein